MDFFVIFSFAQQECCLDFISLSRDASFFFFFFFFFFFKKKDSFSIQSFSHLSQVLYNHNTAPPDLRRRLMREFELLTQLQDSANIVLALHTFVQDARAAQIPDIDAGGQVLAFVTERLPWTLQSVIRKRQQDMTTPPFFSTTEFVSLLTGLIDALVHLRSHTVVHRDLTPGG